MKDHLKEIKEILCEHFAVDEKQITPETTLESLGADSLDIVEIELDIERCYDIEVDAETPFITVGDMVGYLENHFKG